MTAARHLALVPDVGSALDTDLRAVVREELRAVVREELPLIIRAELARAAREAGGAGPRLLSVRAAAKALGVSVSQTLAPAIRAGRVRTVTMAGTRNAARIPADEVERIGREGLVAAKVAKPKFTARRSGVDLQREIVAALRDA